MSHQVYLGKILEPVVKPWLTQVQNGQREPFVLEEHGDSGYGGGSKGNVVQKWKQDNGLVSYSNCPGSPDLAPLEHCWQAPKQMLGQVPHRDDSTTKEVIWEGWNNVSIPFINGVVDSMPKRLSAVIQGQGAMTGY